MASDRQLIIPDAVRHDKESHEILRVWVGDKAQHVSLRSSVWQDPAAWGIMLADLARHIAHSYQTEAGLDYASSLRRIKAALDAELASPTDEPKGEIRD